MGNEQDLLRLLHEVVELNDSIQSQDHKQFISQFNQHIVPQLLAILKGKRPSFKDDTRNKIRRCTLEILHMVPFTEQQQPNNPQLTEIYLEVMLNDNEENAEISIKALIEMQKFYKTVYDVIAEKYSLFQDYFEQLIQNFPKYSRHIMEPEDTSTRPVLTQEQVIKKSTDSLRSIPHCCHYLLVTCQMFEENSKKIIESLVPLIIKNIKDFPDDMLFKVQNMNLYVEFLEILKNVLSFITFLIKRNYAELVINNIEFVLQIQIRILKNAPPQATQIRRDILHMIKFQITETINLEKQDKQQNDVRQHLFQQNKAQNQKNIDDLLDINIIQGMGKPSKELSYYTNSLIFGFIQYMKDQMTLEQLKKSMHLIIRNILDPVVALNLKNTLTFILYRLNEEIMRIQENTSKRLELQFEILSSLIILCKQLKKQFRDIVKEISQYKVEVGALKTNIKWMNDEKLKQGPFEDLFQLEDSYPQEQFSFLQLGQVEMAQKDPIEEQRDCCHKLVKNVVSCVDTVLGYIQEIKKQKQNNIDEMKLMRKFLINVSHIIQSLFEIVLDKDKLIDILKKFAGIFQFKMTTIQFRDLFYSVQDEFFGFVLEIKATKGDTGIVLLADLLMTFQSQPPNMAPIHHPQDDYASYFLEIFFDYISQKMKIFGKPLEQKDLDFISNKSDKRILSIPHNDIQDSLQKLILLIGEKALSRTNDPRMKNLFFTVFVFCIKYTKSSEIIPYYFIIIRNLFKDLCNLNDSTNFVKEFIPMIQGLLETFLQAKEEATFIRETNEICYTAPAKLKNLIEYLPVISKPLIDSMKSTQIELIESGINTIQLWVSALASYPEILDPVIAQILPDLNSMLYRILYLLPNYTFKLLGKLGAKSRLYYEDKEFKSKNYPEDGLKIDLEDKYSGKGIVLGIDSAIDVVLIKIFDNFQKYSQAKLLEAYKLVKSSFLCFIEPDFDMQYIMASIINAQKSNTDLLTQYAYNSTKYFDSKRPQIRVSSLGKGSESHAFEKILKCLLIACSLPKNSSETAVINQKVKKFFKWVTQYFTLIYICKNGKLKQNLINEISPLVFIENICDFLYYNMLQSASKQFSSRSYFKGSVIAIKTMIRMVNQIYGDKNIEEVYNSLEFIQILIQKVCHLAYGQDLPKKVAANIALQLIIKELPSQTIRLNTKILLDSLFHILSTNSESLVFQVEKECKNTLDLLFQKVQIYNPDLHSSIDEKDQEFKNFVLDKILQNIHSMKKSARVVAMYYLEEISQKTGLPIISIMESVQCSYQIVQYNDQSAHTTWNWSHYITSQEIERKAKHIFSMFKGGYTQILNLITYIDLLAFLLKHKVITPLHKKHTYFAICEQLIKVLEDDNEKYEQKIDNYQNFFHDQMISNTAKSAVKYMKLEKLYIQNNKIHDPYSHTMHPHHFLSKQHFEVEELAKKQKYKQEYESVMQGFSFYKMEIFESKNQLDQVNQGAVTDRSTEEQASLKEDVKQKIDNFIHKLFQQGVKVSDINYDYINHFYELYPNVRLHTELIAKALQLLCDITTEDQLHAWIKLRQTAFFDNVSQGSQRTQNDHPGTNLHQQSSRVNPDNQYLTQKIDFYAIEIKSKIIALYFKLFQREESLINKSAKKCLKRTLKRESNQQEALPNLILKECVRPALNILSQKQSSPSHFKHLTKLIYILHTCFNDQLGKHLLKTCDTMKKSIQEAYIISPIQNPPIQVDSNQPGSSGQMTQDATAQSVPQSYPQLSSQENMNRFQAEFERLLYQYNIKIDHLEIANHIIQILYLLPIQKEFFQNFLINIPEFEYSASIEIEMKFHQTLQKLIDTYQIQQPAINYESLIKPLKMKLGCLNSEFKLGLSKFFNKNTYEAINQFNHLNANPHLKNMMIQILKDPNSFCLRERLSRETDLIRGFLNKGQNIEVPFNLDFELGIKIVTILTKYNPNYLLNQQNSLIIDELRNKWDSLPQISMDHILKKSNLISVRSSFLKVQKCFINYCKSEQADTMYLFDLIKGYTYQSIIDLTPTRDFFCKFIPQNFPMQKKKVILAAAIDKLMSQSITYEQKYMIFELIFMPSILKLANSKEEFTELIDQEMIKNFIEKLFGLVLINNAKGGTSNKVTSIMYIRKNLENSNSISHESFYIEIIKVINLFLYHSDSFTSFLNCCQSNEHKAINHFLHQCAKKSSNFELKEWAYFTLSCMYLKIFQDQEIQAHPMESKQIIEMAAEGSDILLQLILQHNTQQNKSLIHKAFQNIIEIYKDSRLKTTIGSGYQDIDQYLKRALNFEGRHTSSLMYLCSFILANKDYFYDYINTFSSKIYKVIFRFATQYQPNIAQRQLAVELSSVLIKWSKKRLRENKERQLEDQQNHYMSINSNILYQLIRTSIMLNCSNEPIKDKLEVSAHCLKEIKKIIIIHNNLRIQFPFFNRLLNPDNDDRENIQLIRMILLNVSYILIKHQQQSMDFKNFFMDYICGANSRNFKCILFSTKIITDIVSANIHNEQQSEIINKLKTLLSKDLARCNEEDIDALLNNVQKVEESYQAKNLNVIFAFQDQAKLIYNAIPHFTIRLLHNIDRVRESSDNKADEISYSITDFQSYKNLTNSIFRVVGYFRKFIVFDQTDILNNRNRMKMTQQYTSMNSQTVYTQPDLITLNNDIVELKVEEPNYDLFNKESIMMGIKIIVKQMKLMKQDEALQILEVLQYIFPAIFKYNTNEYIVEWLRQIVDILINDSPNEKSKLLLEQKASFVQKMLARIMEISEQKIRETPQTMILINKVFEQSIQFLESQSSMYPENQNKSQFSNSSNKVQVRQDIDAQMDRMNNCSKIFEKIFFISKGKNVKLKQRMFAVFEKFSGCSIFKKIQFFLQKHLIDDSDKTQLTQCLSQFLDFTLYNFKTNVKLKKTTYSSRLFPLYNKTIQFDESQITDPASQQVFLEKKGRVETCLERFILKIKKYQQLTLKSLMDPLSEIFSINPSHSTDKLLSDKIFIKVFWQYWNIISREEQQYLAESINRFFIRVIPLIQSSENIRKYSFPKSFLESISAISPQIRIEPEILQYLGKVLNLWHVSIPIIENQIVLYPKNERYIFALNELYGKLVEEDYIAGLRRYITDCPETKTIISYGQHQMWEEINQMFSNYIDFYAQQEGLYAQMDREQQIPGKYSSQVPNFFLQSVQKQLQQQQQQQQQQLLDGQGEPESNQPQSIQTLPDNIFDKPEYTQQLKQENFPKDGPNKNIKELDLRIWETLFIESLKVLNIWEQFRDIAHTLSNQEMMIDFYWHKKEWNSLKALEPILRKSDSIKYQLYHIYLVIQQQQIQQFDDIFKQVIQLAYKEWDQNLPNYIDNIHYQNLIMFQLVMESSEGGRNMIKEAKNLRNRQRLAEIKTAINIWRERIPHMCENIQMWKEILENRNFIYEQISQIISPKTQQSSQATPEQIEQEQQKQRFANELLDITWNYIKLANISRKHGLPNLAFSYILQAKNQFQSQNDSMKYERFKVDYEILKIHLKYNNINMEQILKDADQLVEDGRGGNYDPWQKAEFARVLGEYYLHNGYINRAKQMIMKSLEFNKKEAKTWLSYAKLNEIVFTNLNDEKSYTNALKGYMCGIVLNLHKTKLIIPHFLKLLKRKEHANNNNIPNIMKTNIEQIPTWVWIFWTPQLLNFLFTQNSLLEQYVSKFVLYRLTKLYAQAVYYPVKAKHQFIQRQDQQGVVVIVELIKAIRGDNVQIVHLIENIGKELHDNIKMSPEEELQILLTKILNFNQFITNHTIENDIKQFLEQVYSKFFREENLKKSNLLKKLQRKFYDDFINPETREKDILQQILRLKNFKDFLQKRLSLSVLHINLEEISTFLSNFNFKGIELPGQHQINDKEPLPEHTIFIQKFEPMIYRSGINYKKIAIKGSNSKIYAFTINSTQYNDYNKFCSEERLIQLKIIMNTLFQRHKETIRRGIQFYIPIKLIMSQNKLSQDDLPFANLAEIHDYLFQERGLDADLAMLLQIDKVQQILEEEKEIQQRDNIKLHEIPLQKRIQMNEETYHEMKTHHCYPFLFSSYFHRIFYNVDDLFIFKKQFTIYHGTNSFFNYIFNQYEYSTLNSISFCKTSGRLNVSDGKLLDSLKAFLESYKKGPFDQIEQNHMENTYYVPFRLTNNIVDFIGQIGILGPFAGVITSCSLALSKHIDKIQAMLQLIFKEEFLNRDQEDEANNVRLEEGISFLMQKIKSLSENKNVLHLKYAIEKHEDKKKEEEKKDDYLMFGGFKIPNDYLKFEMERPCMLEEFNKKVFDLIKVAMDDKRLSQQSNNWSPWF